MYRGTNSLSYVTCYIYYGNSTMRRNSSNSTLLRTQYPGYILPGTIQKLEAFLKYTRGTIFSALRYYTIQLRILGENLIVLLFAENLVSAIVLSSRLLRESR